MSYTITNNVMYVRDDTGELVPVSMIASDAKEAITAINTTAENAKNEIDTKVSDANTAIEAKTDEQVARIPEVTTLAGDVNGLKDEKLDKTPGTWPEWTADEQAQARASIAALAAADYAPIDKTDSMTQPIGKDEDGKLWTAPTDVQSDWNENDETSPAFVKNRPFYTGDVAETLLCDVCEEMTSVGVYWFDYGNGIGVVAGSEYGVFMYIDKQINIGDHLKFVVNGNSYICIAKDASKLASGAIYFEEENAQLFSVALVPTTLNEAFDQTKPYIIRTVNIVGSTAPTEFKIIDDATEIVQVDTKYIPVIPTEKLPVIPTEKLPDFLFCKRKTTYSGTFDGITDGRDTFVFNGFSYYKISDFSPYSEDVLSFSGTRADGQALSTKTIGENCCEYGSFIIANKAGTCKLALTSTVTGSFVAPSTGLYARYVNGNTFMTAGDYNFTCYYFAPIGELPTVTTEDAGKFLRVSSTGEWIVE